MEPLRKIGKHDDDDENDGEKSRNKRLYKAFYFTKKQKMKPSQGNVDFYSLSPSLLIYINNETIFTKMYLNRDDEV